MIHSMFRAVALLILLTALAGCGGQSSLLRSWHAPEPVPPVQDLLVVGISTNEAAVRLWERIFVEEFSGRGVQATSAIQVTGFMPEPQKEVLQTAIKKTGAKTVLITHILDKSSTTYTRPGYVRYVPSGFYNNLYGYYGHAYRAVYLPPQDVTRTTVILETNLYDAGSRQLLWTAQTRSKDPKLLKTDFSKIANLLLDDLSKKGLLAK
jgi:hypothetical protein